MTRLPSSPCIGIWKRLRKQKVQLLVQIDAYNGSTAEYETDNHIVPFKSIRSEIRGKAKHRADIIALAVLEVV